MTSFNTENTSQRAPHDTLQIRCAQPEDFPQILDLNTQFETETSQLTRDRLQQLHAQSSYHKIAAIGDTFAGFLIAFSNQSTYGGSNFRWFAERYQKFIYVDRIIVSPSAAGGGVATALYEDLFVEARTNGIYLVTCEYNLEPPNLPSQRFHTRMGFAEVGKQQIGGSGRAGSTNAPTKQVSMQAKTLPD
ncbi:GNAT family N-acetyltransferase [Microbulbifer agarilyticus]